MSETTNSLIRPLVKSYVKDKAVSALTDWIISLHDQNEVSAKVIHKLSDQLISMRKGLTSACEELHEFYVSEIEGRDKTKTPSVKDYEKKHLQKVNTASPNQPTRKEG